MKNKFFLLIFFLTFLSNFITAQTIDLFFLNQNGDNHFILKDPGGVNQWTGSPEEIAQAAVNGFDIVIAEDFNGDGKLDFVVAAFGWRETGEVILLEQASPTLFVRHEVLRQNGAMQIEVADFDRDGATAPRPPRPLSVRHRDPRTGSLCRAACGLSRAV